MACRPYSSMGSPYKSQGYRERDLRLRGQTGKVEAEAGDGEEILYGEYDEIRYRDLGKQLAVIRL